MILFKYYSNNILIAHPHKTVHHVINVYTSDIFLSKDMNLFEFNFIF